MLSEKTRREYKQGMFDLYSEVGTTKIEYYALIVSEEEDIYNEPTSTLAKDPIYLVGTITPLTPSLDPTLYAINRDKEIYNFDIIGLSLEKNLLDPFKMITGKFKFENQTYTINKVTPKGMFTDFFTSYEFECERID